LSDFVTSTSDYLAPSLEHNSLEVSEREAMPAFGPLKHAKEEKRKKGALAMVCWPSKGPVCVYSYSSADKYTSVDKGKWSCEKEVRLKRKSTRLNQRHATRQQL
jgi:hypothetical protein